MQIVAIVAKGAEEEFQKEVKDLLNVPAKIGREIVTLELTKEQTIRLCYFAQIPSRILLIDDFKNWNKEDTTFAVRGSNMEDNKDLGAEIVELTKAPVDLKNPKVTVYNFNDTKGIDLTGDVSKRDYRVFTHRHTLKGTTASTLLRYANFTGDQTVLDPFAKDGTIILEAAHQSTHKSVRSFDHEAMPITNLLEVDWDEYIDNLEETKCATLYSVSHDLRDVHAMKKNAKIAGLNKEITFSRQDIGWLDLKFEDMGIDMIVSHLPKLSPPVWKDLCKAATYITKKIVVLVDLDFEIENEHFTIENEKNLSIGKDIRRMITLIQIKKK